MFNWFDCKLAIGTVFLILITNITTPQDARKRLVLQVYLGSNTLEFSAMQLAVGFHKSQVRRRASEFFS